MDRYPLRSKKELPQDTVPMTTDSQTGNYTTQMQQTISDLPAFPVVSHSPDLAEESLSVTYP